MSLLIIIFIGLLTLVVILYLSTKKRIKKITTKPPLILSPTDFVKEFGNMKIISGTLCFWGNWFGKPFDNQHQIKKVEFDNGNNLLKLILGEGEKLIIWNPSDIEVERKQMRIKKADRILFEWYLYGDSKTENNLRYESYKNSGLNIEFETDFIPESRKTECYLTEPALTIIGF